ncbi:hypothetical protein DYB25_000741 [Aphanomyces astaci]|uniref:Zinc/iron permease n=1 Tax=Aphanomyces astaci TaxID=112090 RepID=A0A397EMR1_APHAT|nr:hypothetical protein DYB36_002191 [Aphanomyces astaci]RHY20936.1 hypothetical protein DYB25_000741 [Aphanomyces astaci]RHY53420.1 hypothetical protein DYB38_003096 [Aphanomyces astaci]RHY70904.1 hypothetical protein DYB30_003194 [Aphanomyces astaci]RHY98186.1 hypothetical protein DYB31_010435 [Aphanomyces astaci]
MDDIFWFNAAICVLLLVLTIFFSLLPLFMSAASSESYWHKLMQEKLPFLTAGVFLSTGMIHLLPDAVKLYNQYNQMINGPDEPYPLVYFLACMGCFLVWSVDSLNFGDSGKMMAVAAAAQPHCAFPTSLHSYFCAVDVDKRDQCVSDPHVHAHVSGSVSEHIVFSGDSGVNPQRSIAVLVTYSFMTPVGIVTGMSLSAALQGPTGVLAQAIALGIGSGSFIYLAFHEVTEEDAVQGASTTEKLSLFLTGVSVMAALAACV